MLAWSFAGCVDPQVQLAAREQAVVRVMDQLDDDLVAVRDAIVRADVADARARAGRVLSTLPALPPGPEGSEQALRLALDDVSGATTVDAAATALGRAMDACAACHAGTAGDRPAWKTPPTRPAEMGRHAEDVDRLWVALIRPSETELAAAVDAIRAAAGSPKATGIDLRVRVLAADLREAAPNARGALYGELLATCADCHATGRSLAMPRLEGVALPDLEDEMGDHYVSALALQLAVTGADFPWIRRAAGELADLRDDPALPPAAAPYTADVRAAAQRALAATTIDQAARATGDLALACGRCHTASGAGPKDPLPEPPAEPHMARHLYGAYWMGFGVYAPDERAWIAGASALATSRLHPGEALPIPDTGTTEAAVHALARRGLAATDPAARAAIWGELLATCAECHRLLEGASVR